MVSRECLFASKYQRSTTLKPVVPVKATFVNGFNGRVVVLWLGSDGKESQFEVLKPGAQHTVSTYPGHVWRFRVDSAKKELLFEGRVSTEKKNVFTVPDCKIEVVTPRKKKLNADKPAKAQKVTSGPSGSGGGSRKESKKRKPVGVPDTTLYQEVPPVRNDRLAEAERLAGDINVVPESARANPAEAVNTNFQELGSMRNEGLQGSASSFPYGPAIFIIVLVVFYIVRFTRKASPRKPANKDK
jgi:hypothetical protein